MKLNEAWRSGGGWKGVKAQMPGRQKSIKSGWLILLLSMKSLEAFPAT